jgi:hypothetical protein
MTVVEGLPITIRALRLFGYLKNVSPEQKINRITKVEDMQKDDRRSQVRAAADSEQKDEDLFVCQHSCKPHVSCSFIDRFSLFNR